MEKWVWESAQSLAGDQDKQMTMGPRAGLLSLRRERVPSQPWGPHLGDGDRVPWGGDVINQQLATRGN